MDDDILAHVFQRLSGRDRISCSQVSAQWRRVEATSRRRLRILDVEFLPVVLPRFPNLARLECDDELSNGDLLLIADCCKSLQVLIFNWSESVMRAHPSAARDQSLQQDMGDDGVRALAAHCRDLRHVSLQWRANVGDASVIALASSCRRLSHLDLSLCHGITNTALETIGRQASCLEVLILRGCAITDVGLSFLGSSISLRGSLRRLDLRGCGWLTDQGVAALQHLQSLTSLILSECGPRISDASAPAVAALARLESLDLSWLVSISDVTVAAIARGCPQLRNLAIDGCGLVTGDGLHALASHRSLENLRLYACGGLYAHEIEELGWSSSSIRYMGVDRAQRTCMETDLQSHLTIEWL